MPAPADPVMYERRHTLIPVGRIRAPEDIDRADAGGRHILLARTRSAGFSGAGTLASPDRRRDQRERCFLPR